MNPLQIIELLANKAQQKQLAPFYIVQNHPHSTLDDFEQWMAQLLTTLLQAEGRAGAAKLTAIADVDTIILYTEERQYKVEQITPILQQLEYPSFTQKHRYWVIRDAHKCTPLLYNKLLKTLETPPQDTTIFLLDSLQSSILPTVRSRAVSLRLALPKHHTSSSSQNLSFARFLQRDFPPLAKFWQQKCSLQELAQKIQSDKKTEEFTTAALSWWQAQLSQFAQCQHFLHLVQLLQRYKKFHGRQQTQLALLIYEVQQLPGGQLQA